MMLLPTCNKKCFTEWLWRSVSKGHLQWHYLTILSVLMICFL